MRPPLTGSSVGAAGGRRLRGCSGGDLGDLDGCGGMNGGSKVTVESYRHERVFIVKDKDSEEEGQNEEGTKVEYRVWNPYRSLLAAAIFGGVGDTWIKPGSKVLYLGAGRGTTVSHVSDLVGPEGLVYAVELSCKYGRQLVKMAKKRTNVIPIIEDASRPANYRVLVGMVDVIFSDIDQSDQASILAHNASYFLKTGGHFVILVKIN